MNLTCAQEPVSGFGQQCKHIHPYMLAYPYMDWEGWREGGKQ